MKTIYYLGLLLALVHAVPLSPMIEKSRKAFDSLGSFCKKDIVLAPLIFGGSAAVVRTGVRLFGESSPVIASVLGDWQKQLLAATAVTGLFFGVRHLWRKDWKTSFFKRSDNSAASSSILATNRQVNPSTGNGNLRVEKNEGKQEDDTGREEFSSDTRRVILWKTTIGNQRVCSSPKFDFLLKSTVRYASSPHKVATFNGASHDGWVKIRIADVVRGQSDEVDFDIGGLLKFGVLSDDGSKFLCYYYGQNDQGMLSVFDIQKKEFLMQQKIHEPIISAPSHGIMMKDEGVSRNIASREFFGSAALSPDCSKVVFVKNNCTVKIYDIDTATESFSCLTDGLEDLYHEVRSVAISPDNKYVVVGRENSIKIFDVDNKDYRYLPAFKDNGSSTKVAYDERKGQYLQDDEATQDGNILSIVFSPDSNLVASGSSAGTAKIWDVETGDCLFTLNDHNEAIRSLAFSSNGKLLASGSTDRTVKIWDVKTGRCLSTLEGHSGSINSVFFEDDGSKVVSASDDHTVKIWKINLD